MKRFHHAWLLIFLFIASSTQSYAEDGFRPLITDGDLSGWIHTNTPQDTWRFQAGVLHCTGKPIGEIRTEKMYQNFILELEWRHLVPGGNAGIFVWADDITSRGVPFHRGIEVQVLENAYGNTKSHTTHGDIFPIHGATMTPINGRGGSRAFPTENRSNPSPQWNHYRIECVDGQITLAVNGKTVTRGKDCVPRKGYICLESEGGVVEYRNIKIKELPGGEVPPEQTAIADRGYVSLYSGIDYRGWTWPNSRPWTTKDWVLAYKGNPMLPGRVYTDQKFLNGSFVVDVRLNHVDSSAAIRIGDDSYIHLSNKSIQPHLEKTGKWNRIEIIRDGDRSELKINGKVVEFAFKMDTEPTPLELQPLGDVDFANIYAKLR